MLKTGEEVIDAITSRIIEKISNENGTAIKYADGTMICYRSFSLTILATEWTAISGWYYSSSKTITFPQAFIVNPSINVTARSSNIGWTASILASSDVASYMVIHSNNLERTFAITYIAIGKWK